jgi:hypothetical protein
MGKGIKMRSATDRQGNAYTVEQLQSLHDRQQQVPELICSYEVCGCDVRFVSRYQQNRKNRIEPVDVPAYIGLTSDSEHAVGCGYDASKQIVTIAARSDKDFLAALDNGKRELRLLLLHNGLTRPGLSGDKPRPGSSSAPGLRGGTSTTVLASGEKLSSYLHTTADLLELRALCESDEVIAAELTLRFGTKRLSWDNFFFERDRSDDAWAAIKAGGANMHPIALVGEVKSHYIPGPDAKYKSCFLNCRPLYRSTTDRDCVDVFEISVSHLDGRWLSTFPDGTEIVMFGLWELADVVETQGKNRFDSNRKTTYITHKMKLRPKFMRQVIAVK